jgi:hypothetical protein
MIISRAIVCSEELKYFGLYVFCELFIVNQRELFQEGNLGLVFEQFINKLLRCFFGTFMQHIDSLQDILNLYIFLANNFKANKNLRLIKLIFPLFVQHDILQNFDLREFYQSMQELLFDVLFLFDSDEIVGIEAVD